MFIFRLFSYYFFAVFPLIIHVTPLQKGISIRQKPKTLMTLLQLLDFLHLQLIFSHFDGVFSLFMGNEQVFGAYFDNFLPLSPRKSGVHTFLQKSL